MLNCQPDACKSLDSGAGLRSQTPSPGPSDFLLLVTVLLSLLFFLSNPCSPAHIKKGSWTEHVWGGGHRAEVAGQGLGSGSASVELRPWGLSGT